jgi:hypothetical protein
MTLQKKYRKKHIKTNYMLGDNEDIYNLSRWLGNIYICNILQNGKSPFQHQTFLSGLVDHNLLNVAFNM